MGITVVVHGDGRASSDREPPSLSFDAPRIVLGRGDGCEVRLPDPSVSARHASLRQHGGSYLLSDEGSTNGTFVGGVRLAAHAPRIVTHGEKVRLGRVWVELRLEAVAQPSTQLATRELALQLVQEALEQLGDEHAGPCVRFVRGPDEGKILSLPTVGAPYILGRGTDVDLMLEEPDASRRHLQLMRRAEQLLVRDLGSKNGTFLAGQRLPIGRDQPWRPGEELRLGQDHLVYENMAAQSLLELERCADEILDLNSPVAPSPADAGAADDPETSPRPSPAPPPEASPAAPMLAAPRAAVQRVVARSPGWGTSDVIIVLLALGVLVVSVGGLWLLFR
jgi:pSer/pThr/pTyr-binding forkhead associated (FHA) protein